jgi:predicted enzyme related to lactoylglutathione lyase
MNKNAVGWFEIYVNDIERARAFYEAVFKLNLTHLVSEDTGFQMWAFPAVEGAPGTPGAIVHMPGLQAGGNSTIVYFICEDCAVEAGRVAEAGGRIFKPKFPIGPYGFISLVVDTEGNMIGLHSMA